jgi:hypothetical protein
MITRPVVIPRLQSRSYLLAAFRRKRPINGLTAEERYELAPSCMSRKEHCEG